MTGELCLDDIQGGHFDDNCDRHIGQTCQYSCKEGYERNNDRALTCQEDLSWNIDEQTTCQRN